MSEGLSIPGRMAYQLGSIKVLIDAGVVRPMRPDRLLAFVQTLRPLGPQPGGRRDRARRTASRTSPRSSTSSARSRSRRCTSARTRSRTRSRTSAWSRATASGSCAATTAASSRPPSRCRSWARTRSTSTRRSPGRSSPRSSSASARRAIVYDEEFGGLLSEAGKGRKRVVAWHDSARPEDPTLDELIEKGDSERRRPAGRREGRAVILTSGTTGSPKGASRGNPQSLDPAVSLLSKIPLKARQTPYVAAPLFHSWGFAHFSLGLILGSTYVLRRKFDPEQCLADIARYRCDSLVVVPVMMQRILELPEEVRSKYDTSSLKVVAASGSALPGDLAIELDGRVRRQPLQPLRLDRGGLGLDRHPRGHARRARHGGQAAARHGREALRRAGRGGPDGRDRAHLRRQRDAVRGLHRRRHQGRDRHADGDRRRRAASTRAAACSWRAATTR